MIGGLSFTDQALHRSHPADNDTLMMKALGYRQQPKSRFEHVLHTYMMMTISQNFLRKKKTLMKAPKIGRCLLVKTQTMEKTSS